MIEIYHAEDDTLCHGWDEFHVARDSNGMFRVDHQCGCSCNYYEEDFEHCPIVDSQAVIREFTEWATMMSPQVKTRELERLVLALRGK